MHTHPWSNPSKQGLTTAFETHPLPSYLGLCFAYTSIHHVDRLQIQRPKQCIQEILRLLGLSRSSTSHVRLTNSSCLLLPFVFWVVAVFLFQKVPVE